MAGATGLSACVAERAARPRERRMCGVSENSCGHGTIQRQARQDLAVVVDGSCRSEAELFVEPGWTAIAERVAGQEFGGTVTSHEFHDLTDDLVAVAAALVPVVDEQFPQEPRSDDPGRLRVDVPSHHDEADGLPLGINSPEPWVRLGDLRGLCQRADHRGHESLLLGCCSERLNRIDVVVGNLFKADRHLRHATPRTRSTAVTQLARCVPLSGRMSIYSPAIARLDDLPPDSRREVVAAVQAALSVNTDDAEAIVRASEPLWDAMEEVGGLVDSWGGGEFCYLFPKMCAAMRPATG